jgi:uncharacterized membrane protein YeaQ/YmgE (transglycosylase-associated protein family)
MREYTYDGTRDADSNGMDILTLILVGLIAGIIASLIVGGTGYGVLGSIAVGIVGAFLGASLFRWAGWSAPWGGIGGSIFVATIGAAVLLLILHLVRGATYGRRL